MEQKILPYEDFKYEDFEVGIDDVTINYVQKEDCTESEEEPQVLTLSTRNNGVGRFINIKTNNWSIENGETLLQIIKDFEIRAGLTKNAEN